MSTRLKWVLARLGVAVMLAAAIPTLVVAQTRSFSVCFNTGVGSCSYFDLTAVPYYFDGGVRGGTAIELVVRHEEGTAPSAAVASALQGFFFGYAGASALPVGDVDVVDIGTPPLVFAMDGAPFPVQSDMWLVAGLSSTTSSADNYLSFSGTNWFFDGAALLTQMIGGCGVVPDGMIDAVYTTEVWTCGGGSYHFLTFTSAWFDVDMVNTVGVTTYARFAEDDIGVAAWCNVTLDAAGSLGDAFGNFEFGDVCSVGAPTGVVPEPATVALLGIGLLGVLVIRRRRLI